MRRHVLALAVVMTVATTIRAQATTACDVLSYAGIGLYLGSAAFDIVTAPRSARKYNREHFALGPVLDPQQRGAGLALSWTPGTVSRVAQPVRAQSAPLPKTPVAAVAWSLFGVAVPVAIDLGSNPSVGLAVAPLYGPAPLTRVNTGT